MKTLSGQISYGDVALAVLLVVVAAVISRIRDLGLERDITVATVRSFVQLLAIGYLLDFVFRGHGGLTLIVLAVMVTVAALTSGARGRRVPGARGIAAAAISVALAGTLGILALLGIIPTDARAVIPLGS